MEEKIRVGTIGGDPFEGTIGERGDGEGGRGTLNGRQHYSGNGCCVEKRGNSTVRSTGTDAGRLQSTRQSRGSLPPIQ